MPDPDGDPHPDHRSNLTSHDPHTYASNASFVYSDKNTEPVLNLLQAQPGERLLDVGCGTGQLTAKLQSIAGKDGQIWGFDSNEQMLRKAKSSYPDLGDRLFQSDAQVLRFPTELHDRLVHSFDAVFTSATLHWCKQNPLGVLEGVKLALKPGGRFVGEFGGFMNCSAVRSALHQVVRERGHDPTLMDPWYFPTTEEYQNLLESAGFTVQHISLVPRITSLDTDLYGWLTTFARNSFLSSYSDKDAEEIMRTVVQRCKVDCLPQAHWSVVPSAHQQSSHPHRFSITKHLHTGHSDNRDQESHAADPDNPEDTTDRKGKWAVMYVRLRFAATLPA